MIHQQSVIGCSNQKGYHGFVVEGEPIHLGNIIGSRFGIVEHNPSLPFVLQCLKRQHLHYLPEPREHCVQRLLQLCN